MKKLKRTNVLKRIIISILCVITIAFSMPAKSKAGVFQDAIEVFSGIPDAIMSLLNDYVSQRNGDTSIKVNLKGIEPGGGDEGKLYNFMVTPYEIITNGKITTYVGTDGRETSVINLPLLNANFFNPTNLNFVRTTKRG